MDILNSNRMVPDIQDVDIAKLGIEAGDAIKQQQSIVTLDGVRDRVTHECRRDALLSIRRMGYNRTNATDA